MYYSEIGKIIEAGLDRDREKVKSFAQLLAKKMEADGEVTRKFPESQTYLDRKESWTSHHGLFGSTSCRSRK